jgi:2'-hydroxyisoflavone reductase
VPWFWSGAQSRHIGVSASIAAGLTYRSLATTIRDTYEWWLEQPAERRENARGWPTPEEERAVLERIAG